MAEITKRAQIAVPMQAGHSVRSVPKQLGVAIKTANKIMKCLEETGTVSMKSMAGRTRHVRTKKLVDIVHKMVSRNPWRNMRKLAKDLNFSPKTIRRIINDVLSIESYTMQRRHLISAASKERRLHRAQKILEEIRSAGSKVFL